MSKEVLVVGDSVTQGVGFSGVTEATRYVTLLQDHLAASGSDVSVTPSALDGVDTSYALKRFNRMVGRYSPDVVIIALGLNDAQPPGERESCSPDQYAVNLSQLTRKSVEINAQPVVATPPPRLDAVGGSPSAMKPYADRAREVAGRWSLPLIDLYERFVARKDLFHLLPDRLHPGPGGHKIIAEQFARTLIPFFAAEP